jgi:hypothetical protein
MTSESMGKRSLEEMTTPEAVENDANVVPMVSRFVFVSFSF